MSEVTTNNALSIPWGKTVGILALASFVNGTNTAAQKDLYQSPFGVSENGTEYALVSGHTVRTSDGSDVQHFVNFQNETITSGATRKISFGGAGFGGMVDFNNVGLKTIELARSKGCEVANEIIPQHNTSVFYSISFSSPFEKHVNASSTFSKNHCNGPK